MTSPAYFNGQNGSITLASVGPANCKEWTFEGEVPDINTTSTGAVGFATAIAGPRKGTGSATIVVDATAIPTFQEGMTGTAILLSGGPTGGPANAMNINCTAILITKVGLKNPSEEAVEMTVDFRTTGAYTYSW